MLNSLFNTVIAKLIEWFFLDKIEGVENIKIDGPVIIVANHNSYLDHFFILYLYRKYWNSNELYFLTKEEAFKKFFSRKWHEIMKSISVSRASAGQEGLKELKKILLNKKASVVLYPEGTRSKTGFLQPGKMGAVALAATTGIPIVPIGLEGTFDILPPKKILPRRTKASIKVGKIIKVKKIPKTELLEIHNKLMQELSQLSNESFDLIVDKSVEDKKIYYANYYNELGIRNYVDNEYIPNVYHRRAKYLCNQLLNNGVESDEIYFEISRSVGRLGLNSKNFMYKIFRLLQTKYYAYKSLKQNKKFAPAHYVLANYYLNMFTLFPKKSLIKAENHYKLAINSDSSSIYIKLGFARLLLKKKNYTEAEQFLNQIQRAKVFNSVDYRRKLEAKILLMRFKPVYANKFMEAEIK
ncbi:1-acyl-sn-glycerol-3-phosphate acyltransferase [Enterococcus sp. DIV0660C]|uniref:1-acyl-sn-glycerol-3-phosphate acyltransferase n=1 Tax=Enterococcus sp. DIV0660C TaxID=2230880 RepID=UPI001A9047C2|nr:1-acyl-sn-glycerol-3-phosphate acyltransferase [Enterococcus sp. DIV0660C]MBO0432899.1 1-acyl-sn-glycerol-3-phosphate acyltransferase [Enterococcus sp. DIV0660C]